MKIDSHTRRGMLATALVAAVAGGLYFALGADALTTLLGAAPGLLLANMPVVDMNQLVERIDAGVRGLKDRTETELKAMRTEIERIEAKGNLSGLLGGPSRQASGPVRMLKTQAGRELPYLSREQKVADHLPCVESDNFDLGEFCRAALLGGREGKTASGAALVPTGVGSLIIDKVRAATSVVRAGAGTILIDGPTNLARITQDATVYQHTEGAVDISESDILATPVTLNPKTLAALVPLTVELVQDSPNLNDLLQIALARAFALKLDALCIATILADANIPKSLAAHDPATWTGTNSAIAAALALNQDVPAAHIGSPANFAARSVILASTAGSWLGKPPYISAMAELFTGSMTADQAIFGDFAAAFAIALRQNLTVEVIRHAKPTSASHLLVAHMRADGVMLQAARLFWQKKVP